ncbi:hypothetical protein [Bdellovibrio sp. BCCA]|uniref:hypothetical protein n=1 Tax=Bdellovibrio sp. BCCA TaxID=3136281 RepID=UPI0030F1B278
MKSTTRYFFTDFERKQMAEATGDFKVGDMVVVSKGYDSNNPHWRGTYRVLAIRECSEYPIMLQNGERELRGFNCKELSKAIIETIDESKTFSAK